MTYQPKCADEMADAETLIFCISLNSNQICTYFCKDLVTGYCLHLIENSIPNCHPFSNCFYYPHLVVMGLTSHDICILFLNHPLLFHPLFSQKNTAWSFLQVSFFYACSYCSKSYLGILTNLAMKKPIVSLLHFMIGLSSISSEASRSRKLMKGSNRCTSSHLSSSSSSP